MKHSILDYMLTWIAVFGVWPFADPGHGMGTIGSSLDVALHLAALGMLVFRILERREA